VERVWYAGLTSSPWHERAGHYAPKGTGAIVSFELTGGVDAGKRFVDGVSLFTHLANIGDVRSLIIHPASTTHSQLTPEQQLTTGVTPGWSACRSGSRVSRTCSPTSRPASRPRQEVLHGVSRPRATGAWRDGDPIGRRRFAMVGDVPLESGATIPEVRIAYETWGRLAPDRRNAVLVLHALTGDSHVVGEVEPGHPTPGGGRD
jgi:hypothetical protein